MHQRKEMKKIHINLIYTQTKDIEILSKITQLIDSCEGLELDTISIENISNEEFKNMTIKYQERMKWKDIRNLNKQLKN